MKKCKKLLGFLLTILLLTCLFSTTALAAGTGDVAGAIEGTWSDASEQIKQVVDNEKQDIGNKFGTRRRSDIHL